MNHFKTTLALVLEETERIKPLHRLSRTKRLDFAVHVCLVAHGIRTGYLVDTFCLPNPADTFHALLTTLRTKTASFNDVMVWHHPPTTQSFVVHVPRLQDKITALLGGAGECVFVRLDEGFSVVSRDAPGTLRETLRRMGPVTTASPSCALPEGLTQETLIPLAAVMIDYPVAYFPMSSTQTSFLEREPLDVYTVSFKWTDEPLDDVTALGRERVLLKFSCPQVLASTFVQLSPSTMIKKLDKFAALLERIGASFSVAHGTETLERVAL